MRKLASLLLIALFLLPGCQKRRQEIEVPLPTEPPNLQEMKPTSPPPTFNEAYDPGQTQ